ncbi:MAG: serine/threonine protein kinase [Limisphaerales bacterium]|nr:MAG: serine/threonine protein kinase [Limisphaerales bacterium]TXT49061.1 MAG: serine/threonine protein kinase [Limisphaerales bacterium]
MTDPTNTGEAGLAVQPSTASPVPPAKQFVPPVEGEVITSFLTGNTYTIGHVIGEGNFGVVYSCTDTWKNALAVKVLKPRGMSYEKVRASAEAEFAKLVALRHPTITYIYDAFEFRDTFYIVTERCWGPVADLFSLNEFSGLHWVMPIARNLLQAIHFLHINKLVHQDIHPGNVFTTFVKDEMPTEAKAIQFKLADLGVAKLFQEVDAANTRARWMLPPEVLKPDEFGPIDYRIDLYHAGLLLLQLASSKLLVFTEEEVLAGKPRELAEALPPPLNFALAKALRRHASARTSSAMELWRDLNITLPTTPTELLLSPGIS